MDTLLMKMKLFLFCFLWTSTMCSQNGLAYMQDSVLGVLEKQEVRFITSEKQILKSIYKRPIYKTMDISSGFGPFTACRFVKIKDSFFLEFTSDTTMSRHQLVRDGNQFRGGNTTCIFRISKGTENCRPNGCSCIDCPKHTMKNVFQKTREE
jgi:hypothetical protein